jgi:hypothetical protein
MRNHFNPLLTTMILATLILSSCATTHLPAVISSKNGISVTVINGTEAERFEIAKKYCSNFGSFYVPGEPAENGDVRYTMYHSYYCDVRTQVDLTGLQMKFLQMRSFQTSGQNLLKALQEHSGDRNGSCFTSQDHPALSVVDDSENAYRMNCSIGRAWYQHHVEEKGDKTFLRTRINYTSPGKPSHPYNVGGSQMTEAGVYRGFFKEISDQLFIEAVALTPAEMR